MNRTQAAKKSFELMKEIERDEDGNPVTLEGVIRSVILKNPDICQYRDNVLDLIYCTLGTGLDWNCFGRLGDHTPNNYMNMAPEVGGQGCWSADFGRENIFKSISGAQEIKEMIRKKENEKLEKVIETVKDIDNRCKTYRGNIKWYPISWYCCHLCVPKNAQKDFIDGAIETAKLIIKTNMPGRTQDWINQQRNKSYATQMLKLLESRNAK